MMKLLRCPFCGGKIIEFDSCQGLEDCVNFEKCEENGYYAIVCSGNKGGCGASTGYFVTKREAVVAWNRRYAGKDVAE